MLQLVLNLDVCPIWSGQPIGTRVLGFVTHELRSRNLVKVLSLASRVL